MKLRRAMAVAAATAVIAPAAFLAAPTAYATDGTAPSPSATAGSTEDTDTPTPEGSAATTGTPAAEDGTDDAGVPAEEDGTTGDDAATEKTSKDGATTEESKTGEDTTGEDTTGEDTTGEDTSEGNADEEPGDDEGLPPYCEEVDENFEEKALDIRFSGLPGKIVAGGAPEQFNLTITNTSEADLKEVAFYAAVENFELDDPEKFLSPYIDLEFKVPGTNEWVGIGNDDYAGDYFWGVETMKSQDFVKIDLRLTIDRNAPAGDSYSLGSGGYIGDVKGQECIAESADRFVDFVVLKPGSPNENPGEAEPGAPKQDKGPDIKPQGDVKQLPVTGNLAETGSSSVLPAIGIAGGIALVAGAGVVFAMKRRKGDAVA
ncbi:LPXTG cell wall anchor domain-containing protein [Streptomyces pacificus]|uniref:LPXTG cell wall anchor domain-containing protein n=1 Tax=Streptomyces pacificus TaxID=2705029 RepID=A0A6A0AT66_9ACTN|nr:LPXTG cell wall anchor domain-containing protein [Streptomyces pacificus]GFH36096.1 LPXTG cell wall anchor domain-containing protein [Streptomyces pacificus]